MPEESKIENKDNNTPKRFFTKFTSPMNYGNDEASRAYPEDKQWKERFIARMFEFFIEEDYAWRLQDFCDAKNHKISYVRSIFQDHPEINAAWQDIKPIIGNRRFRTSIFKDEHLDDKAALRVGLASYDDEFKKELELIESIKAEAKANADLKNQKVTYLASFIPSPVTGNIKKAAE